MSKILCPAARLRGDHLMLLGAKHWDGHMVAQFDRFLIAFKWLQGAYPNKAVEHPMPLGDYKHSVAKLRETKVTTLPPTRNDFELGYMDDRGGFVAMAEGEVPADA